MSFLVFHNILLLISLYCILYCIISLYCILYYIISLYCIILYNFIILYTVLYNSIVLYIVFYNFIILYIVLYNFIILYNVLYNFHYIDYNIFLHIYTIFSYWCWYRHLLLLLWGFPSKRCPILLLHLDPQLRHLVGQVKYWSGNKIEEFSICSENFSFKTFNVL